MSGRIAARLLVSVSLSAMLGACSSMSSTLFPEKAPPPPGPVTTAVPTAGTSVFAPVAVTPGASTGTAQGQRIASLRGRLVALQGEVSARNATLSELRQRAAGEGALYRISKNDYTVAQTPNPANLQKAQAALERFAAATGGLDNEMRIFAKGSAEANKLMNESLAIRDGNEEDQQQLNTLRGEIGQTANQLDRLVNEISNEWALQSAFLAKERAALASLGASAPPVAPAVASAALLSSPAFVTIKFDRTNVSYREALAQAVSTAKRRKPDTTFDVVGVASGAAVAPEATARAQEVANTLATLGVEAARIRVLNGAAAGLQAPEVRIYAR